MDVNPTDHDPDCACARCGEELARQRMRDYDRRPKRSLNTLQGLLLGAVLGALLFVAIVWVGANVSLSGVWHPFG